jgi:hypothetical protein
MLLARIPGLDVRSVHLVRDSRGVAYSWSKVVMRPDTPGRDVEMLRLGPVQVGTRWMAHNAMMEVLGRRVPAIRMRYEDLFADTRATIARALEAVAEPVAPGALDFIGDAEADLEPDHTIMGNPMRMSTGRVPLRLDDAWRSSMHGVPRATVTALTWPLLVRYGYSLV